MSSLEPVQTLRDALRGLAEPDDVHVWPHAQWNVLDSHGGCRWNIPAEFGGDGFESREMLDVYRLLASGSLLTAFILTQRNAACQRIETSANENARRRLLPQLASSEVFATVGISHLTTSRQHVATPAVRAVASAGAGPGRAVLRLTGSIPWVTGASQADILVTGGTLDDATQILVALPTNRPGVVIGKPIQLLALSSSSTSVVELDDVEITEDDILHGPVHRVMASGSGGGAGGLVTSAVAIGAAQGWLDGLKGEAGRRSDLSEFCNSLSAEASRLESRLVAATGEGDAEALRQAANSLAIRTAESWLAATKGAGFVSGHPAERAVRESMFFLVWSCPQAVLMGNLRELTCRSMPPEGGEPSNSDRASNM